jgi:Kef-type K+ transport system membrane component KefB
MGATVANLARHHDRPFHAIENLDGPVLVIFFVLAGAIMELDALTAVGPAALAYLGLRALGRGLGVAVGARFAGAAAPTRKWMGAALLPQAGVALGLALAVNERFPEMGARVLPLVIVATLVFEFVGPVMTRLALRRVGEGRP